MTDLDLIRELRPDEPLAGPAELAPARERLTAAIAGAPRPGPAGRPGWWRSGPPWRSWRLGLAGPAVTAVAAAVAVALVLAPAGQRRPHSAVAARSPGLGRPAGPVASAGSARHGTVGPFTGVLTAKRFLHAAARAALATAPGAPQPGQFVYSELATRSGPVYQNWLSANGSRAGLFLRPNDSGGRRPTGITVPACSAAVIAASACAAAGYFPDMPTSVQHLLAFLVKIGVASPPGAAPKDIPNWYANDLGKAADVLLQETYLLPAQRAAIFDLMARTPGFTVARHVPDVLGRDGVAIRWSYQGGAAEIIFDPRTYAYLGDGTSPPGGSLAATQDGVALVKFAIVNSVPSSAAATAPTPVPAKVKVRTGATPTPAG